MSHIAVNVKTGDLQPGQVLAEDVRDFLGRPLLFKGVVLNYRLIQALKFRENIEYVKILVSCEEAPQGVLKPDGIGNNIPAGIHQRVGRFFQKAREIHELQPETVEELSQDIKPIINEIFDNKPAIMDSLQLISDHDNHTHHHSWMVMILSLSMLRMTEMQNVLKPDRQDKINAALGALLHDVGKTRIPLKILNKPGKLSPEEWDVMKKHPAFGYSIVKGTPNLLPISKAIVGHHHLLLDGSGYSAEGLPPLDRIPPLVRIVTVADIYEAIVSDRPYHFAALPYHAMQIISQGAGTRFDSRFIDALDQMVAPFPTGSFLLFTQGTMAQVVRVEATEKDNPIIRIIGSLSKGTHSLVGRICHLYDNLPGMPGERDLVLGAYSPQSLAEKIIEAIKVGNRIENIVGQPSDIHLSYLPEWEEVLAESLEILLQKTRT